MKLTFFVLLKKLKKIIYIYDGHHMDIKLFLLQSINKISLPKDKKLIEYHDLLLFLASHPENIKINKIVDLEFHRIGQLVKSTKNQTKNLFLDTGLPFSSMITRFSHDLTQWMYQYPECKIFIDSYDDLGLDLNTILKMTLPSVERDETTASLSNDDLLDALKVPKKDQLQFLLNELSTLNSKPLIKDYFWEALKLFIEIQGKNKTFSRSFNKAYISELFYQNQLVKKFDHLEIILRQLPTAKDLNLTQKIDLISTIKKSLLLTLRETDPSTYMDESSLRFFELERGISIAIYGMQANRQLPLQSYIGYTLFKNGFPAAYGGSWIFGKAAMFGLNIFECFRGGESGYMMCQLLRVYKQVFNIEYFEVEPYQYGLDNPDGIKSGAFWFYHRYGFRPVNLKLNILANRETAKIKANPQYRSSSLTLLRFTESNIALHLDGPIPLKYLEVTKKITEMISREFHGNRSRAIEYCNQLILKHLNKPSFNEEQKNVLEEVGLFCNAFKFYNQEQLNLIIQMIQTKPIDPYLYNTILSKLIQS